MINTLNEAKIALSQFLASTNEINPSVREQLNNILGQMNESSEISLEGVKSWLMETFPTRSHGDAIISDIRGSIMMDLQSIKKGISEDGVVLKPDQKVGLLDDQTVHLADDQLVKLADHQSVDLNENQIVSLKDDQTVHLADDQLVKLADHQSVDLNENQIVSLKDDQAVNLKPGQVVRLAEHQLVDLYANQLVDLNPDQVVKLAEHQVVDLNPDQDVNLNANQKVDLNPGQMVNLNPNQKVDLNPGQVVIADQRSEVKLTSQQNAQITGAITDATRSNLQRIAEAESNINVSNANTYATFMSSLQVLNAGLSSGVAALIKSFSEEGERIGQYGNLVASIEPSISRLSEYIEKFDNAAKVTIEYSSVLSDVLLIGENFAALQKAYDNMSVTVKEALTSFNKVMEIWRDEKVSDRKLLESSEKVKNALLAVDVGIKGVQCANDLYHSNKKEEIVY